MHTHRSSPTSRKALGPRLAVASLLILALASPVDAVPQASGLHWARATNPITISVGDNLRTEYDAALVEAVADWNRAGVLSLVIVPGSVPDFTRAVGCYGDTGTVQACNTDAGPNGIFGSTGYYALDGHIIRDGFYLNDYYLLGSAPTPTPSPTPKPPKPCRGRKCPRSVLSASQLQHTICHELGHAIGLGHSTDPTSCMVSGGSSADPAQSDLDSLRDIYSHSD